MVLSRHCKLGNGSWDVEEDCVRVWRVEWGGLGGENWHVGKGCVRAWKVGWGVLGQLG